MLTGLALVLAGVAILACARSAASVQRDFTAWRVRVAREERMPRWYVRLLDWNGRFGARLGTFLGCAIGVAAILYGATLILES